MKISRLVLITLTISLIIADQSNSQLLDDLFNTTKSIIAAADSTLRPATDMTDAEERDLGERIADLINQDLVLVDDHRNQRVKRIGRRLESALTRNALLPYNFALVEDDTTINAFASAGGWAWVYTGILDMELDDDELASVLAHEMAHVDQKHCVHRIQHAAAVERIAGIQAGVLTQIGYSIVKYPFSKDEEIVADTVGVRLMYEAGFDPHGMLRFMDRMIEIENEEGIYDEPTDEIDAFLREIDGYLTSHPHFRERREAVAQAIQRLK